MFIAQNQKPSHMAFERFIKDDLTLPIEDIFYEINKYIESKIAIDVDTLCIDDTMLLRIVLYGVKTQLETEQKDGKNLSKQSKKSINFFASENIALTYSILKEPSIDYILTIAEKLEEYMNDNNINFVHGKGKRKLKIQKLYEELKENGLKLLEYAIQLDMLGERNSCFKTDIDATFMHMKYDYYNHTNVFKPGYNVQIGVSDGFIKNIYVRSDCNDLKTYISFMEKYKQAYGTLPSITPADAGDGSYSQFY